MRWFPMASRLATPSPWCSTPTATAAAFRATHSWLAARRSPSAEGGLTDESVCPTLVGQALSPNAAYFVVQSRCTAATHASLRAGFCLGKLPRRGHTALG